MVRIKWLKSSRSDLKEIYKFIGLDSKRYAKFQVEKIRKKTEILKMGNFVGKKVFETNNENIREIFEGDYRIIYRIISKKEIHILLIHHGARDLNRRLDQVKFSEMHKKVLSENERKRIERGAKA